MKRRAPTSASEARIPAPLPSKQAVVYIIDTSPSMNNTYPSKNNETSDAISDASCSSQTRLDAAKEALIGLITDLMLKSKTNECAVLVLHTLDSARVVDVIKPDPNGTGADSGEEVGVEVKEEDDDGNEYSNITKLSSVQRPTVELLRKIQSISIANSANDNTSNGTSNRSLGQHEHEHEHEHEQAENIPNRSGGFCDGIMLATSLIHLKTASKKFQRKIILLTDAEREVDIHWEKLDDTVEALRGMNCDLTVVGLEFQRSAEYSAPADIVSGTSDPNATHGNGNAIDDEDEAEDKEKDKGDDDTTMDDNAGETDAIIDMDVDANADAESHKDANMEETNQTTSDKNGKELHHHQARVKDDNEMFLISLTKYTGGKVHAAHTIQQILKQALGRRIPKSALSKVQLEIVPGVTIDARVSLSTTKQSLPTLKREAVVLKEDGEISRNALGEIMALSVTNVTSHWNADEKDVEVELTERASGFPYGSDLIPIGPMEMEGLKLRSPKKITILGYTDLEKIPMAIWMGPTRIISGCVQSRKACLAISALSQALYRKNQLAICTFVKTKDSDPTMGVLAPLVENVCGIGTSSSAGADINIDGSNDAPEAKMKTRYLLFVPMPFSDDMTNLTMNPFSNAVDETLEAERACSEFIDAFTLPPGVLNSETIPNPAIRSFRKTTIQRAIDPKCEGIFTVRSNSTSATQNKNGNNEIIEDPMATPSYMMENGRDQLKNFKACFPLKVVDHKTFKGKKKKKFFFSDSQDSL